MIFGIDVKIIAALIALLGVILASVLSAGAYFYKVRVEVRKSSKRCLYYLLEIRHFILSSLFDPKKETEHYIEHYAKHLASKGITLSKDDFEPELLEFIEQHFNNIVSSMKTKALENLVKPYEDSLLELSAINPVLAYSLRGRETLAKLLSQTKEYSDSVPDKITIPEGLEWMSDLVVDMSNDMSEKAIEDSLAQLEEDIIALAKSCDSKSHKYTKMVLENRLTFNNKATFSELDVYLDQTIEKMALAYQAQTQVKQETSASVQTACQ